MSIAGDPILSVVVPVAIGVMVVACGLAGVRLLRGPSLPDRVVALDLIGTLAVGSTAIYAMYEGETVYLIVSVALALLLFIGTVAFAFYLHRGARS